MLCWGREVKLIKFIKKIRKWLKENLDKDLEIYYLGDEYNAQDK